MVAKKKRKTPRGKVGEEIFKQVEKMVAAEKISRSAAFDRIASKTGRNKGTVAVNYYRVARKRGAVGKRRGRRTTTRVGAAGTKAVLKRAEVALHELAALVKRQEAELATLRKENASVQAIRKLIRRA
jgi:hypothetical protein